jgi:hypothetical protein
VDVLVRVGVAVGETGDGVDALVAVSVAEGVSVIVGIAVAVFVGITREGIGVGVDTIGGGAKNEVGVTVGRGVGAPIRT